MAWTGDRGVRTRRSTQTRVKSASSSSRELTDFPGSVGTHYLMQYEKGASVQYLRSAGPRPIPVLAPVGWT